MRNTLAAGNNTLAIGMEYYIVRNEKILPNEAYTTGFLLTVLAEGTSHLKNRLTLQTSMDQSSFKSGFVSIVGKPNVGKSSLVNKLMNENLSIITAKAQTTRHRIMGILNG